MKIAGIVILVLCATVTQMSFVADISCLPCTISCGFSNCYQIKASGYTKQVCGRSNCQIKAYKVTFGKCTYDMAGQNCPTGVCVLPENQGCAERVLGIGSCNNQPSWYQISCGACARTANCDKCAKQQSTEYPYNEICLGSNCNGVQTLNASLYSCPERKDSNGNQCFCCYSLNNQYSTKPGICTSLFPLYSSEDFNAYARTAAELRIYFGLLLAFVLALMI